MLANKTGANIQMVHVINKNDIINIELHHVAKLKFEDILQIFKGKYNSNVALSYTIKEGKIFEEVTNLAEKFEDPLVVLSTHGASGFEELFIGGNTYKITSHSKVPVITVRKSRLYSNIDKIILPMDITFQTREKVPYTIKLAKLFNSEIHLVTLRSSKYKSVEKKLHQYGIQVASYIEMNKIAYKVEHLLGDNLTDITLEYSNSVDADLISIMTEQEKSVSNLLLGSYAHQMINKATIPVFSFPNYPLQKITEDIWDLGAFNVIN
jgi:nucleotide-binding universal stress UspA family protein